MSAESDRMRRARIEFEEASARGCTIFELRREKAREEHAVALARLETRQRCGRPIPGKFAPVSDRLRSRILSYEAPYEPWMMRD